MRSSAFCLTCDSFSSSGNDDNYNEFHENYEVKNIHPIWLTTLLGTSNEVMYVKMLGDPIALRLLLMLLNLYFGVNDQFSSYMQIWERGTGKLQVVLEVEQLKSTRKRWNGSEKGADRHCS